MSTEKTKAKTPRIATFGESLLVILALAIILIGGTVLGYRYEMMMVVVAVVAGFVAVFRCHIPWKELEESISLKMKGVTQTIILIFSTGLLVASLIYSGSVPLIIRVGLEIISPRFLYVSAFALCAIMSTATGSSWSSAGTAGVAMYGLALGMGANLPITVGAIIAGSIFGDKLSPLSETTNMAPACAGTDLYSHIRSMLWTTLPAALIGCVIWLVAGFALTTGDAGAPESALRLMKELDQIYNFNLLLLLPFVIIVYAALTKRPVIPCMTLAILSAILLGWLVQGFELERGFYFALNGFTLTGDSGAVPVLGFEPTEELTRLLNRGGAKSMAGVVIMCYAGFSCAAIIARAHYLDVLLAGVTQKLNTRLKAMAAALGTNIFIMLATGTAYVAFIMVSEMYKKVFLKNNMGAPALSRSLEDIGTCLGCLIPWSLSGAYYAGLFAVPIFGAGGYALWTVMPYVTPLVALVLAATGLGMYQMTEEERKTKLAELDAISGEKVGA